MTDPGKFPPWQPGLISLLPPCVRGPASDTSAAAPLINYHNYPSNLAQAQATVPSSKQKPAFCRKGFISIGAELN